MTDLTYEQQVEQDLRDDESHTSPAVIETVKYVARLIPRNAPKMGVIADPDDDGRVDLVIHSSNTKRQATFRVGADGNLAAVATIDEKMANHTFTETDDESIRKHLKWVTNND